MKTYIHRCQFCGTQIPVGHICMDCANHSKEICPLKKPLCGIACPYKKEGICDYPFIGRVKAYPDKLEAK